MNMEEGKENSIWHKDLSPLKSCRLWAQQFEGSSPSRYAFFNFYLPSLLCFQVAHARPPLGSKVKLCSTFTGYTSIIKVGSVYIRVDETMVDIVHKTVTTMVLINHFLMCIKVLNVFHSVERIRHPKGPVRGLRRKICRVGKKNQQQQQQQQQQHNKIKASNNKTCHFLISEPTPKINHMAFGCIWKMFFMSHNLKEVGWQSISQNRWIQHLIIPNCYTAQDWKPRTQPSINRNKPS